MKKVRLLRRGIGVVLALVLLMTAMPQTAANEEEPILSFLAMSDLHLDDLLNQTENSNMEQFQDVLDAVDGLGLDLFIGGGDYSSYGNTYYWYKTRDMVTSAGIPQSLWTIGNHEYGTTGLLFANGRKFLRFTGEQMPYYTKEINGCTFIVLGAENGLPSLTEDGIINMSRSFRFSYSAAQIRWFLRELKKAADSHEGKPIFVISHYNLKNINAMETVSEEMASYKNVFFLWGHLHNGNYADMTLKQCINTNKGFVAARMGSVHYYNNDNTDGLIVRVYTDRVELQMLRVSGSELPNNGTVTIKLET